jgi:hypothetical protein
MKKIVSLLCGLPLMATFFSPVHAESAVPNLAGKWHSTEFKELAGRQLHKMQGHLDQSILTGSYNGSIEQAGRFLVFKYTFKLSAPVVTAKKAKTQVDQGEDVKYCVIGYDNTSLYCIGDTEAYNVIGKIENGNTISFVEFEAGQHNDDPYLLYSTMTKD